MNERQKGLLAEIRGGKRVFNTKGNTEAELTAFQVVVSDLQEIEEAGFISIENIHEESQTGSHYVDHVRISIT